MRKSRFSAERIIAVSEHPFDRWRAKYGGMEVGDARKVPALEDENHLDDARAKIETWRIGRTSRISPASSTSRAVSRIRGALGEDHRGRGHRHDLRGATTRTGRKSSRSASPRGRSASATRCGPSRAEG